VSTFDLPTALENARTFVRERAVRHAITLNLSVDERSCRLRGSTSARSNRFFSLAFQCSEFHPEEHGLELKPGQADGSVEISVSDTGIGIAPRIRPKIFEEFRQVGSDTAHKVEGTDGLTLPRSLSNSWGKNLVTASWARAQPSALRCLRDHPAKLILIVRITINPVS